MRVDDQHDAISVVDFENYMTRRPKLAVALGVSSAVVGWLILQLLAQPPAMLIGAETPQPHGAHRQLVVLLHGYAKTAESMAGVRHSVEQLLPDADVMVPEYSTWMLSNTSALDLANALNAAIDRAYSRRPGGYDEVILVGHSMGSLIARKAYVIGRGQTEEVSADGFRQPVKPWASRVSRIVLMAGMNRGWSIAAGSKPKAWPKAAAARLGTPIARWLGVGKLILGLQRGAPFVSNLTLQWLNLTQMDVSVPNVIHMPTVIQLLGTDDDIVAGADNIDLYAGRNFFYRRLNNTGHANVIDFQDGATGEERRQIFEFALNASTERLRDKNELEPTLDVPDLRVQKVIFVMHGIRDFGGWTGEAKDALEAEAHGKGVNVKVITSGYGYFSMGGFLLFRERQKNVRWFVDHYTEARALYPNAQIEYLGHSNGTYLLASALQNYRSINVDRVVFAGSVVRRDYDWESLMRAKRVLRVRNYVATADWVVGFFPYFFELSNYADIGGAGLFGFTAGDAKEIRYVPGEHGAAIESWNLPNIADFLIGPEDIPADSTKLSGSQDGFVVNVARVCWIVWLVLVAALTSGGYLIGFKWRPKWSRPWQRLIVYAVIIVVILNTA